MAVKGPFSSGIPTNPHASAMTVRKYLPTPRIAHHPFKFNRDNLTEKDITQMWGQGRIGPAGREIGMYYNTAPSITRNETTLKMIPKHELEKFMPNIDLGPKALVTPVSTMVARDGQRVTHDLIHSSDPYIGRRTGQAGAIDYDNITPQDPSFVGLHPDSINCRARIYRWLRRGPLSEEDGYFHRNTIQPQMAAQGTEREASLYRKIIRLAKKGKLKAACEEYRKAEFVPPVQVYRALIQACVPGGKIADAVELYNEGDKLMRRTRDHEVFISLIDCAIQADHLERIMWVFNEMQGTSAINYFDRVVIDPLWQYQVAVKVLEYTLDRGYANEAKTIFSFLAQKEFLGYDLEIRRGQDVRAMLEAGKPVDLSKLPTEGLPLSADMKKLLGTVALAVYNALPVHAQVAHTPAEGQQPSAEWLKSFYADLDVEYVLRLARFSAGGGDLAAKTNRQQFLDRAVEWLRTLSQRTVQEAKPLPYLFKTKASAVNPNVRVACLPTGTNGQQLASKPVLLSPTAAGGTFHYCLGTQTVEETYPDISLSIQSKYLVRQPIHREIPTTVMFGDEKLPDQQIQPLPASSSSSSGSGSGKKQTRILHPSLLASRDKRDALTGAAATGTAGSTDTPPPEAADSKPSVVQSDEEKMFGVSDAPLH